MTINATSLLGLALPVTGTETGTWGDTVNDSLTALLDTAVAGTTTLSTDADVTLTATTLAANQARQAVLLWTASGSTTRNITAPAQSKPYIVINSTGGTQSIVIRGAGPTTGVTVVPGEKCQVAWNGSDFVKIAVLAETVYALSGVALNPANGTIQTKTLAADPTFTDSLSAGTSMVLMLNGGASYTVTWPTITWVTATGNDAPTLTANDTFVFWKISTTLYGAYVGSYA